MVSSAALAEGEVSSKELGRLSAGRHELDLDDLTSELDPGVYRYRVEVVDEAGDPVEAKMFTIAHIDGLRYTPDGPVLIANGLEIALANVIEVSSRDESQGD